MLTKTIQIAAICFSMANPSNFNIDQPKKANENQINYTLDLGQMTLNTTRTINNLFGGTWKQYASKSNKVKTNDYLQVSATKYIETLSIYQNNTTTVAISSTKTEQTCSQILAMQITPYNQTINNVLNMKMYILTLNYEDNVSRTVTLNTEVYISQENYWANYIDVTYGTSVNQNQQIIDAITNSEMGFLYSKNNYTKNYTTGNEPKLVSQDLNIYLDPTKVNYIYIYTYITAQAGQTSLYQSLFNNNLSWTDATSNMGTMTGTYIPGIQGYEVIDVPGIMWEVLTMPFTFISIAFNLTIFPNTPYQVNLSNLFLSIIGIIIFAWILQKFVRKV